MAELLEDREYDALGRFSAGVTLRLLALAVGAPILLWAGSTDHAVAIWAQRLIWLSYPISGALMIAGANGFGARAAGLGFSMATLADAYGALMGWYGSPSSILQIPYAHGVAEVVGLMGMTSILSSMRGFADDGDHDRLVARGRRATVNVVIALAGVIVLRAVMFQELFAGLLVTILAGAVAALAIVALLHVKSVTGATRALRFWGQREEDRADEVEPAPQTAPPVEPVEAPPVEPAEAPPVEAPPAGGEETR